MPKMRAAQVARPGGPFEIVEREIPQPAVGQVRVKVQACGICHSDSLVKEGHWPGIQYPRVPGHEVVGVVDAVGAGVAYLRPCVCSRTGGPEYLAPDVACLGGLASVGIRCPESRVP